MSSNTIVVLCTPVYPFAKPVEFRVASISERLEQKETWTMKETFQTFKGGKFFESFPEALSYAKTAVKKKKNSAFIILKHQLTWDEIEHGKLYQLNPPKKKRTRKRKGINKK